METTETIEANRVIEALGGPSKAGEELGISKSAVSQWRKNGVPKTQMKYLRVARPELFTQDAPQPSNSAQEVA